MTDSMCRSHAVEKLFFQMMTCQRGQYFLHCQASQIAVINLPTIMNPSPAPISGRNGWKTVFAFLFTLLALLSVATLPAATKKPNIVLLLVDDMGWSDLACYGADLHESPNIDRLATQGVRFTQAYMMPVCSPSRAAILTGQHAARLHMTIWREGSLQGPINKPLLQPHTEADLSFQSRTIANYLKEAGYATLHVGKWHLGDNAHAPQAHGFDVNIGGTHWGAPNTYFYPFSGTNTFRDFRFVPGLGLGKPGDYLTDRLTDEAIKLMQEAGDKPFYLNLWFHSVHAPIEGKPELTRYFEKKLKPGMHHQNPGYAAMVRTMDTNVGRVLDYLDKHDLTKNTLVILTSDNGGYINLFQKERVTDNYPLRSGKGSVYEGGVRVPFIVRMPGMTPKGKVCETPVVGMDILPTICEIAGVKQDTALDGMSIVPLLKNQKAKLPRNELYFHYPHYYATTTPVSAVRSGDWKLLHFFEDNHLELYNLKDDLGEKNNLAATQPVKVAELEKKLEAWWKQVDAQFPTRNANYKPKPRKNGGKKQARLDVPTEEDLPVTIPR